MMQPMMTEAARQAPHVMGEMMKPMVIGAGGYAAARVLTTNPALSFLRAPLVVFAAGVTTGYLLHKYRREIIQAVTKAADMGTIIIRALAGGALSGTAERHPLAMRAPPE